MGGYSGGTHLPVEFHCLGWVSADPSKKLLTAKIAKDAKDAKGKPNVQEFYLPLFPDFLSAL